MISAEITAPDIFLFILIFVWTFIILLAGRKS